MNADQSLLADIQGQLLLSERRVLPAWLEQRGNHPSRFLFTSPKFGRVHRSQLHSIFADIAERAGLAKDNRCREPTPFNTDWFMRPGQQRRPYQRSRPSEYGGGAMPISLIAK